MNEPRSGKISVAGAELEVAIKGSGEPVVFIHGVGLSGSYLPLTSEPVMSDYRTIRYHRRGYGNSTLATTPLTMSEQAADCRALIDAMGLKKAHIVGHSYGGCIALQLAMDSPEAVHTLALFEPVLFNVPSADQLAGTVAPLVQRYMAGERSGVLDDFFVIVDGPSWRREVEAAVPGAPALAEQDIATLFEIDLPSTVDWNVEPGECDLPVLYVLGSESMRMFHEGRDVIAGWFPRTEHAVLQGANHLLQMRSPADAAAQLVAFLERHPMEPHAPR